MDAGAFKAYLWEPTGETTRTIYSDHAQVYKLTVTDINTCKNSMTFVVEDICRGDLYIPNAFTPNKDGLNDLFSPASDNLEYYSLVIYNRWGEMVFSTTNPVNGWDGSFKGNPCASDTYFYVIKYKQFGQSTDKSVTGNLTLLR